MTDDSTLPLEGEGLDRVEHVDSADHADTFVIVPGWLIEHLPDDDKPPRALDVYVAIGSWADNRTGQCRPSRRAVAERAGLSLSALDRCVTWLIEVGAITKRTHSDARGQTSNRWTVHRAAPRRARPTPSPSTGTPLPVNGSTPSPSMTHELDSCELEGVPNGTRAAPSKAKPRDDLFDALADAWGVPTTGLTKSQGGVIGKAKNELLALDPPPDGDEIRRRAANYRTHFGDDVALTPRALVTHWATCAAPKRTAAQVVREQQAEITRQMREDYDRARAADRERAKERAAEREGGGQP